VLTNLRREGEAMVPELADHAITASYAGLRPATEHQDYQLATDAEAKWITVSGVRSTGLTAALGLGEYVADNTGALLGRKLDFPPADDLAWPAMRNLAEGLPRAYRQPYRTDIVCHCEWVTEDDVAGAFDRAVPPGTLGGLKRRTRAMMGRCQGFNCMGRVLELADGRLAGTRPDTSS
jgi:glycerol-3-phosphate dehydrogenase